MKSFAGESQARSRYTMLSKIAKKEGYEQIAAIFLKLLSKNWNTQKNSSVSKVECLKSQQLILGIEGTTAENLLAAEGENEEWSKDYPHFADVAEKEGFPEIAEAWRNRTAELQHEKRYRRLLEKVEKDLSFQS